MGEFNTGAENVRWDLTDLYCDEDALRSDLAAAENEAAGFASAFRGRMSEMTAEDLAEALRRFEAVQDRAGRAITYAYLQWSTATQEAEGGALLQSVREAWTRIGKELLFFELEWMDLADDRAAHLLEESALAPFRHHLELQRLVKQYVLSEKEEKILVETAVTGPAAWTRFFTETTSAMRFPLDGEELTQQRILSKLHDSDRDLRRRAALGFSEGLTENERALTYIFNTLLADKASRDGLRGYPDWIKSRNIANEIDDESAEALIEAVTSRYDLVARFYALKRRLLGLDELRDWDRYAPVGEADTRYVWEEARDLVLEAYDAFDARIGDIARRFFDGNWIDAPIVPGKRGGAFSHGAVPSAHPYILLNFDGKPRDVQTLAHELGHGVHQYLSRPRGLQADTPLTTAETASVFGEMLVFERLTSREPDLKNELALVVAKIDDTLATVFRQVAMNRFEDRIHTQRRTGGELSAERFGDLWIETQEAMYGGSVTLGDHYRRWWSYIPHFLNTPGYVYAYAFGELLVLALHARYLEDREGFPERYIELLAAGGSDWPHVLVGRLGIDLKDPGFWHRGLGAIENLIVRAENLAEGV